MDFANGSLISPRAVGWLTSSPSFLLKKHRLANVFTTPPPHFLVVTKCKVSSRIDNHSKKGEMKKQLEEGNLISGPSLMEN